MNTAAGYIRFTKLILAFVFIIILAGGVVRTTQSGMGCPDWPHCFGMWIPPTNASQLPADYEKYLSRQDIDHTFNAMHTWIEWINRMLTGVLGILILIHVAWSYKKYFRMNRNIFLLSASFLIITAFEAWLGKLVVDTNLAILKITAHMLMALALAVIPVIILNKISDTEKIEDNTLKGLIIISLIILLLQIFAGTDVREQIDEISKSLGYAHRELWIAQLNHFFDVHRIMAFITALFCILVFWRSLNYKTLQRNGIAVMLTVLCTIALGFIMATLHIPAFAQPLHLLLSSILFILLFACMLQLK